MRILLCLFILISCSSSPKTPSICDYLKMDNCNNSKRGLSRSAGASLPSVNAAAFTNPAAIALSRGWGVESIHYGGEAQMGLVYGTGRIGGAIASYPNDGTFFGNLAVEDSQNFRRRTLERERFKEEKFALATGANIFGGKKKKGLSMDIGLVWRRQMELEENNFGGGISFTYNKFLSFGYARYSDIYYLNLNGELGYVYDQFGNATQVIFGPTAVYQTEFEVESFIYGLKFSTVAFDYVKYITTYEDSTTEPDEVVVWNLSYFYRKWIFSYGRRHEDSSKELYFEEAEFISKRLKDDSFLGAQYATNNGFLLGAFINYYLLDDISLGLTFFF